MATKKITLLWVVHFHQPLGNFDEVFERYTTQVCQPFIATIERHPSIRLSLHFSGILLSYFKEKKPELLAQIGGLVKRGQVELLGGGFYEPILGMIPEADAELQLQKMAQWIEKEFGVVPHGAWLPESVWEPRFIEPLHRAGYRYAVLEDSLFEAVGWKRAHLFRAFSAEFLNRRLVLFPSHRVWSRQLPLEGAREIKAAFTQLGNRAEGQIVTLAQNGDQYGLDPIAHAKLYEGGAFDEWLQSLAETQRWVETARLIDIPQGTWPNAHLPGGAGEDLEACALPEAAQRDYLAARAELARRYDNDRFLGYFRGGTWLGFIGKYAEAGLMLRKLLWLREQILELAASPAKEKGMEAILAAEEHSAYWHARRGGIYANYLRDAVYQRLIQAEEALDTSNGKPQKIETDYDGDGNPEVLLRTPLSSLIITPQYGGSICEFNFRPTQLNLGNAFRRRLEAYRDLSNDPSPVEDWYERRLFQDHFVPPNTPRTAFQKNNFAEYGDFIDQPYEIVDRSETGVTLERQGGLYINRERRALTCRKEFRMESPGHLFVTYTITNKSEIPTDVLFVCEVNYTCLSGSQPDRLFRFGNEQRLCGEEFSAGKPESWSIEDQSRNLLWRWQAKEAEVWHHPVDTVTLQAGKLEWDYQGSAMQLVWPLQLAAGATAQFHLECEVRKLDP